MVSGRRDISHQHGRPRPLCAGQSARCRSQAGPGCETTRACRGRGKRGDAIPGHRDPGCRTRASDPGRRAGRAALRFRYRQPSGRRVARTAPNIGSCPSAGWAPAVGSYHRPGVDSGSNDSRLRKRGDALAPRRRATARARRARAHPPVFHASSGNDQPAGGQQAPRRVRPGGPDQDARGRGQTRVTARPGARACPGTTRRTEGARDRSAHPDDFWTPSRRRSRAGRPLRQRGANHGEPHPARLRGLGPPPTWLQ